MSSTTPAESQRSIDLGDSQIAYRLRRSHRRSIGLTIDQHGLRVAAPLRAPLYEIEGLIRKHAAWVLGKLAEWQARPAQAIQPLSDGALLEVLGRPRRIKRQVSERGASATLHDDEILLQLPVDMTAAPLLEKLLRQHARQIFLQRLAHYAPVLGVAPPPLRLSSARTRWGSCSHHGGISLNWRLVLMPLAVLDYVVCHELAHLREMNHSPRFWSVVEQLYPDWRAQRLALRELGRRLPQFG